MNFRFPTVDSTQSVREISFSSYFTVSNEGFQYTVDIISLCSLFQGLDVSVTLILHKKTCELWRVYCT